MAAQPTRPRTAVRIIFDRVTGADVRAVRGELAEVRTIVASMHDTLGLLNELIQTLNHDVRSGSEDGLPLFLGYAERFRTDADAMVGAVAVIDRQLQRMTDTVAQVGRGPVIGPDG